MMPVDFVRDPIRDIVIERAVEHNIGITPEVYVKIVELLSDIEYNGNYLSGEEAKNISNKICGQLKDWEFSNKMRYV